MVPLASAAAEPPLFRVGSLAREILVRLESDPREQFAHHQRTDQERWYRNKDDSDCQHNLHELSLRRRPNLC